MPVLRNSHSIVQLCIGVHCHQFLVKLQIPNQDTFRGMSSVKGAVYCSKDFFPILGRQHIRKKGSTINNLPSYQNALSHLTRQKCDGSVEFAAEVAAQFLSKQQWYRSIVGNRSPPLQIYNARYVCVCVCAWKTKTSFSHQHGSLAQTTQPLWTTLGPSASQHNCRRVHLMITFANGMRLHKCGAVSSGLKMSRDANATNQCQLDRQSCTAIAITDTVHQNRRTKTTICRKVTDTDRCL